MPKYFNIQENKPSTLVKKDYICILKGEKREKKGRPVMANSLPWFFDNEKQINQTSLSNKGQGQAFN